MHQDKNYVYCFIGDINYLEKGLTFFTQLLSREEEIKAAQFFYKVDSMAYTISHAILRLAISRVIGLNPREIQFDTNKFGKPCLPHSNISFNISHSRCFFSVALSQGCNVGVDIETVNKSIEIDEIKEFIMDSKEIAFLDSLESTTKRDYFFRHWTQKEALLKAYGTGLADSLSLIKIIPETNSIRDAGFQAYYSNYQDQQWKIISTTVPQQYYLSLAADNRSFVPILSHLYI